MKVILIGLGATRMQNKKIAVVGASIAGCATTVLLKRLGYHVETFEKSNPEKIQEKGFGVGFSPDILAKMKRLDLIDESFTSLFINDREYYKYNQGSDVESFIFKQKSNISTLNWYLLYEQLLKRVDKSAIFYDTEVESFESQSGFTKLNFKNHDEKVYDAVFFCDGVHSLGRRTLVPNIAPQFSGYVAWRGIVTLALNSKYTRSLDNKQELFTYKNGLGFYYPIPSRLQGSLTLNSVIYEKINPGHLLGDLMEGDGKRSRRIFSPEKYTAHYQRLVNDNFSSRSREIFNSVKKPFLQPIMDLLLKNYFFNDSCVLVGDASTLLQPVTGSGAVSAIEDAINIYEALLGCNSHVEALDLWSINKKLRAVELHALGRKLGDFYVLFAEKWQSYCAEDIIAEWNAITSMTDWYIKKCH